MRQMFRPRIKKRSTVVLALTTAGAFGVGLIAPVSAAAAPPLVPACTPKASTGSDSCVTLKVAALDGSIGTTFENARLGVRTSSVIDPPSGSNKLSELTLRFDDQIALNVGNVPVCFPSEVENKNIAQAYEQCGPGADGNPPSEGNAYLSPPANVSGIASTAPNVGNVSACAMVFRGPNWDPPPLGGPLFPTLTLYFRAPPSPQPIVCNNPATNTGGTQSVVLEGFLTREAASSPYDWRIRVNVTEVTSLDDFYWTVARGATFRARCPTSTYKHKLVGIFDYSGTQPTDTIAPPYPGTTDTCP